jgi:hypothetical protein
MAARTSKREPFYQNVSSTMPNNLFICIRFLLIYLPVLLCGFFSGIINSVLFLSATIAVWREKLEHLIVSEAALYHQYTL